jgi:hypothetical protein
MIFETCVQLTFSASIPMNGPYQDALRDRVRHVAQDPEDVHSRIAIPGRFIERTKTP